MTVSFSADVVLEALYHGLLGREPDPDGRATYMRILEESPAALSAWLILCSIARSEGVRASRRKR